MQMVGGWGGFCPADVKPKLANMSGVKPKLATMLGVKPMLATMSGV